MNLAQRLLVIIDPTHENHLTLERALIISKIQDNSPIIHLFISVETENADLSATNDKLYRDCFWLKALRQPLAEAGLEYTFEICWSSEWQDAVIHSAERFQADHIFLPDPGQSLKRSLFSNAKWGLVRKSKVPVTIVRPGATGRRKKILAAVNIQSENNPKYAELNEKILSNSLAITKQYNAELFVVNAYSDSLNYPDREKLIQRTGLDSKNVHAEQGDPAEVISHYAEEIGADTVIIGTLARTGAAAIMKGNTSEKVLQKLHQDVITYSC